MDWCSDIFCWIDNFLHVLKTRDVSEERRAKLREVEIRVLQYQDELEQGIRSVKQGYSIHRQVAHYRHKMMRKVNATSFWLLNIWKTELYIWAKVIILFEHYCTKLLLTHIFLFVHYFT